MSVSVHNPDQYMASLRQVIGQGRKRIGFLVGAGAPASILASDGKNPLIPTVMQLTTEVLAALDAKYKTSIDEITMKLTNPNIEDILTRTRSLAGIIGAEKICGLDSKGHNELAKAICSEIGKRVDRPLPPGASAYTELINWVSGTDRQFPVEIFTTNYDLLFEQTLERAKVPFFDGFSGAKNPFFDPPSVYADDLPSRWVRLWKLHGSIGWQANDNGEVIRLGQPSATHLVYPEHKKYDQTQKAPYSSLFDRLRAFLTTPDTLLIVAGFSFADAHISAVIEEALAANASSSVFAFQFKKLADEIHVSEIASRRSNLSAFAPDAAIINGIAAPWSPGEPPTRDWGPIRATYWDSATSPAVFTLGHFDELARFFASSRTEQTYPIASAAIPSMAAVK